MMIRRRLQTPLFIYPRLLRDTLFRLLETPTKVVLFVTAAEDEGQIDSTHRIHWKLRMRVSVFLAVCSAVFPFFA